MALPGYLEGELRLVGAGDLDGDGFDDVVIHQDGDGPIGIFAGSAEGPKRKPVLLRRPAQRGPRLVRSLGDVNGDGYADLLVGDDVFLGGPHGLTPKPAAHLRRR